MIMLTTCLFAFILGESSVRDWTVKFNSQDEEIYTNAVSNADAADFLVKNVPRFECPDRDIERTYYFRWWTYRKHLRKTPSGWVVTEFLPDVPWAGKYNTISCPLGHQLREGRWLRDRQFLDDYTRIMLAEGNVNGPKAYACWPAWATLERLKVTGDGGFAAAILPEAVRNYEAWERGWEVALWTAKPPRTMKTGFKPERGLFDLSSDREGSEFQLSAEGARPMVNAAMWAEAKAISEMARSVGDEECSKRFAEKAAVLEKNIREKLWNRSRNFFTVIAEDGRQDDVLELHGYAPFYFGMPLDASFNAAWKYLVSNEGFSAPLGLVFPARATPGFVQNPDFARHECMWNGPSWPYATSVALTALYRRLQGDPESSMPVSAGDFSRLLVQYARQHQLAREDGTKVPWIDENLDAFTGDWVARKILSEKAARRGLPPQVRERGKDYNHSTFCDLVIAGLCGFIPSADGQVRVKPLAPEAWDWWCIDGIRYHGREVSVLFDRDGTRYGRGKGLRIIDPAAASGVAAKRSASLSERTVHLPVYPFSDPDPVPPTAEKRYPYFRFDGSSSTNAVKPLRTYRLENGRIALDIMPEIGGKIWGATDLASGFDFIYRNHAVKFRNVAMRGPWLSGGIEYNFGIIGHGPYTSTPVDCHVKTNSDGSVSCFISMTEFICRTVYQVEVRLAPGDDHFTTHTLWYNASSLPQPYYHWMNSAAPAEADMVLKFDGKNEIGHAGDAHPWPVDRGGRDLSLYANNAFGHNKSYHVINGDNGVLGSGILRGDSGSSMKTNLTTNTGARRGYGRFHARARSGRIC